MRLLNAGVKSDTAEFFIDVNSGDIIEKDMIKNKSDKSNFYPVWSFESLLSLIPPSIYAVDSRYIPEGVSDEDIEDGNYVPDLLRWQMLLYRNDGFEFSDGEKFPAVYGLIYESVRILPPDHPICPNSMEKIVLCDKDGKQLCWSDENPIEVCIKAIEWLRGEGYKLYELK